MANFIVKNLTVGDIELADCGLIVPASGQRDLLSRSSQVISDSTDLPNEITNDNLVLLDTDGTTQLTKAASLAVLRQKFDSRQFLNSNDFTPLSLNMKDVDLTTDSNWAVGNSASLQLDTLNTSLQVATFDDTNEEGIGFVSPVVPLTATKIKVTLVHKRETAGISANSVLVYLYARRISNGIIVPSGGAWTPKTLFSTVNVPDDLKFVYDVGITDLSTVGIEPGEVNQIQITREGGTLTGNWNLLHIKVEFL